MRVSRSRIQNLRQRIAPWRSRSTERTNETKIEGGRSSACRYTVHETEEDNQILVSG
jgi:hypothetical protein